MSHSIHPSLSCPPRGRLSLAVHFGTRSLKYLALDVRPCSKKETVGGLRNACSNASSLGKRSCNVSISSAVSCRSVGICVSFILLVGDTAATSIKKVSVEGLWSTNREFRCHSCGVFDMEEETVQSHHLFKWMDRA